MKDVLQGEADHLRAELRDLKQCQLRYFTLALVAAGGLIGARSIFGVSGGAPQPNPIAFLAPLVVILPCWLTFFDKATTITRIVAYLRILESELLRFALAPTTSGMTTRLLGFESSLRNFRAHEDANGPKNPIGVRGFFSLETARLLTLRTRHRYWSINWLTFASLAWLCALLPFFFGIEPDAVRVETIATWGSVVATLAATIFSLYVLVNLHGNGKQGPAAKGKYSYEVNDIVWSQVL